MYVVAFNGSPRSNGNTYQALKTVCAELVKNEIDTKIIQVGDKTIKGCLGCGDCARNKDERCITDDSVNAWIQKMKESEGILLGSPVHYSGISGAMKSFLDRAFMVAGVNKSLFRYKVGASVAAVRRSGGLPAFHQLNNYLSYSEMFIPTSNYWNVIHGTIPGEAEKDAEGLQIMRILGKNMAWLMKVIKYGKGQVTPPEREKKTATNFIR